VKRPLALLLVGITAMVLQGAINAFVPARFTPDLGFLVVIALGLRWRSAAGGLVLAALLGFVADVLSGSLLGEHALMRIFAYACARAVSRQLNLRGVVPQVIFVLAFTLVNAFGVNSLDLFFRSGGGAGGPLLRDAIPHAFANALFAPVVSSLVESLVLALGSDEAGRNLLRLEPRRRAV
jgi:rod shape-determining protein MreD